MKNRFLLAAAVAIIAASCGTPKQDAAIAEVPKTLSFNAEGKFKIIQFTDLHFCDVEGWNENSLATMRRILDIEKPDLAIYTGDYGRADDVRRGLLEVVAPSVERSIPFVILPGNHDHDAEGIGEIYASIPGSLTKANDCEGVSGDVNQVLPIMSASDSSKVAYALYLIDSGVKGVDSTQTAWYVQQSEALQASNGGQKVNALAFFHIPTPEFNAVRAQSRETVAHGGKSSIYGWDLDSFDGEGNEGFLEACAQRGDVKAVCVGHDHDNDFVAMYGDVALIHGHYSGGIAPYHLVSCGARLYELTEGNDSFETWVRLESTRFLYRMWVPESLTSDDPKYKPWP